MSHVAAPLLFLLLLTSLASGQSSDWPSFRGPDRSGVSRDTGLLQAWPMKEGPKLLWEAKGAGRGYASLAIANGRIYTLGDGLSIADDADEYLTCFDEASGEFVWKAKTGPAWRQGRGDWQSSRGTPTIDGDRAYVITPHGVLVCMDASRGDELWRKDLMRELGGAKGDGWGYSESPLIDGQRLVCTPGGERATMAALDKLTGDVLWTTVREGDRGAGHASIVLSQVGDERVYVQTTASGALGVRAEDGKLLWSYPIERTTAVIPTPIVRDDLVFFSAGYRRGGALLRQKPAAGGEVEVEEVYPLQQDLSNKHGGVVLVGDRLYGDSDDDGILFCAELMTGKVLWKERGPGSGSASVTAADDRLYVRYASGVMALIEPQDDSMAVRGEFTIPGSGERPGWSHPVVAGRRLYLREQDSILCYDVATGR